MTDHVELVEEVNGKSDNVVLEAEIHRSFDMIQSAFDQCESWIQRGLWQFEGIAEHISCGFERDQYVVEGWN